jgi:hypothetical protein
LDETLPGILDISTRSADPFGVSLSAFNLLIEFAGLKPIPVECAYQGSKIFERGGPFQDLYEVSSREAKLDSRLRTSGDITGFRLLGKEFPGYPKTAFYDWLYVLALSQNEDIADRLSDYAGFTDSAFDPSRSLNCQAKSAAVYVGSSNSGSLHRATEDWEWFFRAIRDDGMR